MLCVWNTQDKTITTNNSSIWSLKAKPSSTRWSIILIASDYSRCKKEEYRILAEPKQKTAHNSACTPSMMLFTKPLHSETHIFK